MLQTIREVSSLRTPAAKLVAIADARTAAETAARIARATAYWAVRSDLAADDATEVLAAAVRARQAADTAEFATTPEQAWLAARAAWAAVTTAEEADRRVTSAIAESLAVL
jgi:hypothetical protein